MQRSLEQRMAIKFCVKLGKTAVETVQMIKTAFKEDALSMSIVLILNPASKIKTMLIVFFDIKGLVHHKFVPPGTTVNAKFYVEVLKRLKRRVQRIRPDIAKDWKLHHDNALAHTAFLVANYLANAGVPTIPQPPYSPDLAPLDFFLFSRLKGSMKGKHFKTIERIQAACTAALKDIPEEAYRGTFAAWKTRWSRCVNAGGAYFEEF